MPDPVDAVMLLSKQDFLSRRATQNRWARDAYDDFERTVTDRERPFPCVFAQHALAADTLRFLCLEDPSDPADLRTLVASLMRFNEMSRALGPWTTLVAMFAPSYTPTSLDQHHKVFWQLIQFLHEHDPEPWPADVPIDPDDPRWEFAFAGEAMFVVGSAPVYEIRQSRNTATFTVLFQPRWMVNDMIAQPKFHRTTAVIRDRQARFDGIPSHPSILTYGDPDNREWRQYVLPDGNTELTARCPFRPRALEHHPQGSTP
jgi:FPC/CPF motif-containing protein YcgG